MEFNELMEELVEIIKDRKEEKIVGSYTSYLFEEGLDKILKKVGEESSEVIIACKNASKEEQIYEISDLIYHLTVLMVKQGIEIEDIVEELGKRRKKTLNKKPEKFTYSSIH
ncbi:phosphoribosyl-ATP diphosphatase [Clostridium sporogenes]|jgi:phosphoribosyl-ATP pyrophosphohydrolase|uniref:phosphoribosyl-ATP diphosphatase n=1 Tax=Clostridium TaxID=1485 RepID=UPI001838F2ED|nr:phosphoribosyl-ATP diphosphatase [Clostridium cochlearium]MBU5269716.1 phosphoribosyl-ATP diphosphatase [Clostridium cochlearium]NMA58610.1 phosphoribosyl-ATP diphosphatase [Clostridium cochlearium]